MTRVLLACLLFAGALRAQPGNFVVYSLAQGLPQSQVFSVFQDSRGYLWLGTQGGGLCRFDGQDFVNYTTDHGLPSNYVNAIFEDTEQRLWVGTNAGLCFIRGKSIEKIPEVESRNMQVLAVSQTEQGEIWIGTDRGLFACNPANKTLKKLNNTSLPDRATIWALCPSQQGMWVATDAGAYFLGKETVHLSTKNGLLSNAVRGFLRDESGRLWVAAAAGGVTVFDEKSSTVLFRLPQPAWSICLVKDHSGKIWIGSSDNGLFIFDPGDSSLTQITENQGLPHHYVRAMAVDNTGNVWVGTSGGGVVKFLESQPFTQFGPAHGLAGSRVYALEQDNRGRLLMAVSQAGLQMVDSSGIVPFSRDSGWLSGTKVKTIAEDNLGRIWAGTEGKGVVVFDSSGRIGISEITGNYIQKIIRGAPGEMWVAGNAGISRVSYSSSGVFSIRNFGRNEGLKGLIISTLATDSHGGIWFSDQHGNLGLIMNGRVERIFGPESGLSGAQIRCIAVNAAGRMWLGTKGTGIFEGDISQDPVRFEPLKTPKKLPSDNIYLLTFDQSGNLWAGSESGVDKIAFGNGQVVDNQHFGRNEGFLGIETCQDAALCDRKGNLWFGTMNGLMKYAPSGKTSSEVAPRLHFEDITLFYKPLEETKYAKWVHPQGGLIKGLALLWNENHLSFEFRAVDLGRPDAIRYRWRLEGATNAQWSPLSEQTAVNFAGLPPGSYVFQVQATSDGNTFSETLSASFSIKQPFWQLLWFQLAVGVALLGLVVLIARRRIRRIQQAEAAKRAQLEMQNHLLQLEQKALQLQMNPHFIFNALNSIQSLVSAGDASQARAQIGLFAQLMRNILNNSRKQLISLKDEVDTLDQYLQLEQFCQHNKFEYRIDVEENVEPEELEIPPMLFQPFVENAVIHGISHLDRPGTIHIRFSVEAGRLKCAIRDNGIGREKAERLRRDRKPGHQSVAMGVTRERLEAMKKGADYQPLQINDITDQRGVIAGTEVIVQVPAHLNF